jgi:hypothetical protein
VAISLIHHRSLNFDYLPFVCVEDTQRTMLSGFDIARSVYHDVRPTQGHIDYGHIDEIG